MKTIDDLLRAAPLFGDLPPERVERLHASSFGVARIAATSSVMSMPTGHQVMQRPQPTQPELPNWSCQVPSLCVSHWR